MMLLPAKEHLETPEAEGGKEGFCPTASRKGLALLTPFRQHRDFGPGNGKFWVVRRPSG